MRGFLKINVRLSAGLGFSLLCGRFRALKDLYPGRAGAERPSSKKHAIIASSFTPLIHVKGEEFPLNKAFDYPTVLPLF